jgi:2-dehydrotetronate isomerase
MSRFSANLGFLWTDRALPDAIRAAKAAGFDAVECHWPYEVPPGTVKAALKETQLRMLGLNTRRGDVAAGDNGLAAIPGRQAEARAMIEEAIGYAVEIGVGNIHVMAGYAEGTEARRTFIDNLVWACNKAARQGLTILIEPLNAYDAPGYFLQTTHQAAKIIKDVGAKNLKLMFDCYHVGRTEGDVIAQLKQLLPITGHIQFASVPDRGTPDHGEVDYRAVFALLDEMGWDIPLGAEYKPQSVTEASLAWMSVLR